MKLNPIAGVVIVVAALLFVLPPPGHGGFLDKNKTSGAQKKNPPPDRAPSPRIPGFSISVLAKYLSLDKNQEKKMTDLVASYRRERVRRDSAIKIAQLEFLEIFHPADPDLDKMAVKLKELAVLQAELRFDEVRKLRDARPILNDEQFDKYKKLVLERFFR